ncbi:MAG TPA: hypothetical protein VLL48_06705, partial [Longimicrobiales bacterium]|nr:hypothetical protein [Longimicrobiales bacterium]
YLIGLRQELDASAVELASDQEARRAIIARTGALLDHARSGALLPPDSVSLYLEALTDFRFFTPVRTVLDDLVASGGMALLRSEEARRGLLGYVQEMERLQLVEAREREFVADQVEPWLSRHVPLGELIPLEEGGRVERVDTLAVAALQAALDDPELVSLMQLRWRRTDLALRFAGGVERWIDRAREGLE